MIGLQGDEVFYVDQNLGQRSQDLTPHDMAKLFKQFLKDWIVEQSFIYRSQILSNGGIGNYFVEINFADLESYDLRISMEIRNKPLFNLPLLEESVKELFLSLDISKTSEEVENFQINLVSGENPKKLRNLKSEDIGKLIKIEGIIISAGENLIKGQKVVLECKYCGHNKSMILEHGFSGVRLPTFCENSNQKSSKEKCPRIPYRVLEEQSTFIDYQILKIQEITENIPTGEIPRTYKMCVERYLCDKLIPGNRVFITGVYAVRESSFVKSTGRLKKLKTPYIYVLGYKDKSGCGRQSNLYFTPYEEERFKKLAKEPDIFGKISRSIGVNIYGNNDIKKAIACMLFGGSPKKLPDKTKLRGDINILLIGDPSTAKSQFLKFVKRVAPVCIYTSGKGSSAAGLTASIIRDPSTKQFHLEGGALVLADGGIVCIDEFDKMRTQDRIAIHEAMEQQTISIAKAGITTILNSRTSILAASNPTFGSYVSYKSRCEQIDLQSTILSRFDCIFTVVDQKNKEYDRKIAKHIINIHLKKEIEEETEIDLSFLKKFIAYARANCFPRLVEESSMILENLYIEHRSKIKDYRKSNKKHIPITVRQLEAIIRLSESIAKMRLSEKVEKQDILKANDIFLISTMNSLKSGIKTLIYNPEKKNTLMKIEEYIRNKLPINNRVSVANLEEDLEMIFHDIDLISEAIALMITKGELQEMHNSIIKRKK